MSCDVMSCHVMSWHDVSCGVMCVVGTEVTATSSTVFGLPVLISSIRIKSAPVVLVVINDTTLPSKAASEEATVETSEELDGDENVDTPVCCWLQSHRCQSIHNDIATRAMFQSQRQKRHNTGEQ